MSLEIQTKRGAVVVGNHFMSETNLFPSAFSVFSLEVTMNIDLSNLDARYRQAQALVNPDRFINATPLEQRISAEQAIKINKAYHNLKDPISRAGEVLKAHGLPIPGENGQTISHPHLLEEILDWREQIENCNDHNTKKELAQSIKSALDQQTITFDNTKSSNDYLRFVYLTKTLRDLN